MKRSKLHRFLVRLLVVFIFHLIIKGFDESFGHLLEITTRGLVFSMFFISYWVVAWYIAAFFNEQHFVRHEESSVNKHKQIYLLFLSHSIYGLIVAFLANYLYRTGDMSFFGMYDVWSIIPVFNAELTCSLWAVYMMIFSFDIYIRSLINKKEDQLQLEKLKQENTLAKYLNLKSQIEPHFLFNSLSVLSSIIYSDVNLASDFILRLSKILRYVIEKNELLVVPLKDEISFINDYIFLIKTRFEDGIIFENSIDENSIENHNLPPVSLQLLVENAIKHNKFTNKKPLHIRLYNDDKFLIVKNNIDIRDDVVGSTKQGLDNLSKRFSFLSDKPVEIKKTDTEFIVSLPILLNKENESFNI